MATKSTNTKGNPYHDESDGKFTSADGQSTKSQGTGDLNIESEEQEYEFNLKDGVKEEVAQILENKMKFKEGFEEAVRQKLQGKAIKKLEEEANAQFGGKDIIQFAEDTNLDVAKELVSVLFAYKNDWGQIVNPSTLYGYGTRFDYDLSEENIKNKINGLLKTPIYAARIKSLGLEDSTVVERIVEEFVSTATIGSQLIEANFKNSKEWDGIFGRHMSIMSATWSTDVIPFSQKQKMAQEGKNVVEEQIFNSLGSGVGMNPEEGKDKDSLDLTYNLGVQYGFCNFPDGGKGGGFAVMAHELGHFVDRSITNFMLDSEKKELKQMFSNPKALYKQRETTKYGRDYGQAEIVAEAFCDYYCNGEKATATSKKVVDFYKKIYNRVVQNASKGKSEVESHSQLDYLLEGQEDE